MGTSASENTAALVEHAVVLLLVAALLLCVAAVLLPLATAILFGAILAIATWPLRTAMVERGVGPGVTAVLLSLAVLVLVGLPLIAAAPRIAKVVSDAAQQLEAAIASFPATPPDRLGGLPVIGPRLDRWWRDMASEGQDLHAMVAPYAGWLRGVALSVASALAASVLQFLLALIVAAMFWTNGDTVAGVLRDVMQRLGGAAAVAGLDAAGASLRSVAYGVVGTACIQGLFMALGALIAGVPAAGVLGFAVMLLAISQIGAVLIPVAWGGGAWWLLHQGETGRAIFLLVWGAVMVTASDNVIRPMLIRRGVAMPLTLVILGVFGGFLSFGFLGLFIGPAGLAVAYTLLQAWRRSASVSSPSPPGSAP